MSDPLDPPLKAPTSKADELIRLSGLARDGIITAEQFEAEKLRLMGSSDPSPDDDAPSEELERMNAALDRAIEEAAAEHRLVGDHTPTFGKRNS